MRRMQEPSHRDRRDPPAGRGAQRARWRRACFVLLCLVSYVPFLAPGGWFLPSAAVVLAALLAAIRWTGWTWADIGLRSAGRPAGQLGIGVALGAGAMTLIVVGRLLQHGQVLAVERAGLGAAIASALVFAAYSAVAEEVLFRGYLLRMLGDRSELGLVLISTAAFVVYHLPQLGVPWPAFLYWGLQGALLALAAIRTGALWLLIGLHLGGNLVARLTLDPDSVLVQVPSGSEARYWVNVAVAALLLALIHRYVGRERPRTTSRR